MIIFYILFKTRQNDTNETINYFNQIFENGDFYLNMKKMLNEIDCFSSGIYIHSLN